MKNNSEQSPVNAGQSVGVGQLNIEKNKQKQMKIFWTDKRREMENVTDLKNNLQLPPTQIKKIMKKDEDVRMIAAESSVLLVKACELFIQELTLRSWLNAQENHRRILKNDDVTDVIMQTKNLDFLVDDDANATDGSISSVVSSFYATGGSNGQDGNNLDHQRF